MDGKTKEALKLLQAEIRQLQSAVAAIQPGSALEGVSIDGDDSFVDGTLHGVGELPADKSVLYSIRVQSADGADSESKVITFIFSEAQISRVSDEAVASIGYALSSPQKSGLLRALLGKQSESAAALGESTGLSTGSLYHHLRDLMHAELITQTARNRYVLTERGLRVLLVMSALAA